MARGLLLPGVNQPAWVSIWSMRMDHGSDPLLTSVERRGVLKEALLYHSHAACSIERWIGVKSGKRVVD